MAFIIVRNDQDADEILADTLMTAWQRISSLRDPKALRSWMLTTATRHALRRRRRPQPRLLSLDAAHDLGVDDPSPFDRLALADAIDRLPPRMRAVVALHYVADLPVVEVSAAVGTSTNTVKTQLREARARLRVALSPDRPRVPVAGRKEAT